MRYNIKYKLYFFNYIFSERLIFYYLLLMVRQDKTYSMTEQNKIDRVIN